MDWQPTKIQKEFIESDEFLLEFSRHNHGSGKTEALIMLPIYRKFYLNKDFYGILIGNFRLLKERCLNLYTDARYYPLYQCFKFSSGASICIRVINTWEDICSIMGNEFQYIGINDITPLQRKEIRVIACRARPNKSGITPIVRIT